MFYIVELRRWLLIKVHGGIMAVRGNKEHAAAAEAAGIQEIDLVVLNL